MSPIKPWQGKYRITENGWEFGYYIVLFYPPYFFIRSSAVTDKSAHVLVKRSMNTFSLVK